MKYYHVSSFYHGEEFEFTPSLPYYLQKGEDKRTHRICVTANWRHSLRSIIVIKHSKYFFVYSTEEEPINPIAERERLLNEKKIRSTSNDFKLPRDGIVNKELWFTKAVKMKCEGMIILPNEMYGRMIMALGFSSGDPDVEKLQIEPYREIDPFAELRGNKYKEIEV